jgi:proteic killer suppression protein
VIKSFHHAGLEKFFLTGSKAGIRPDHAKKLQLQLGVLNHASAPADMDVPGWGLHPLKSDLAGHWATQIGA